MTGSDLSIATGGRDYTPHYPPAVDWRLPIDPRPVYELLDEAVRRVPEQNAIDFLDKKTTYAELSSQIDRFAKGLQDQGLKAGDRVGLFLPNCPYFVIAYFGILKAGGIVVNFNPLYVAKEIEQQIKDSGTSIMVTLDLQALYAKLQPMLGSTPLKTVIVCSMAQALPFIKKLLFPIVRRKDLATPPRDAAHPRFEQIVANDGRYRSVPVDPVTTTAVLQYTGGTTGIPKGAMLTHANLYANAIQCRRWFSTFEFGKERVLGVLPFFHVFAMTVIQNQMLSVGAEIVMLPRFELEAALKTIETKKPTFMAGVPTMYTAFNTAMAKQPRNLSSIRNCISGGAPLPLEVKQRFEQVTGCFLVEGYGLTESSPVATGNPLGGIVKAGSIGLPMPLTTVELRDIADPTKIVKRGERGEICIRGPQVMAGYWNRPEATQQQMVDGALRTGDIATMDEDGYFFIVDRMKDLILCSGFNVYPRVVEEAVYQHLAVEECTVIGIPDSYRGQSPKAFVKLQAGKTLTQDELLAFLKDKLNPIEMPREIEFRDALPKTLIGKLSKKELVAEEEAKVKAKA
ncbi:MAG: long-chain fatty acid--CoA ligase [Alphaproteobacteria bacterium]|nr:long-chain fatty acid--CoA ligase [Alphaproteobacteria bacterium]